MSIDPLTEEVSQYGVCDSALKGKSVVRVVLHHLEVDLWMLDEEKVRLSFVTKEECSTFVILIKIPAGANRPSLIVRQKDRPFSSFLFHE